MTQTYATATPEALLARTTAMSAGDMSLAVRAELGRLLTAGGGDRRKALPAGLDELVGRNALTKAEATELGRIVDRLFDVPDGSDPQLAQEIRTYYRALTLDPASSPAALAVASVVNSLVGPRAASGGELSARAISTGDVGFGAVGALVGAGIGWGFGGPVGAGIGAVVGAAVGVCIEKS
jgi:hypothetical protein